MRRGEYGSPTAQGSTGSLESTAGPWTVALLSPPGPGRVARYRRHGDGGSRHTPRAPREKFTPLRLRTAPRHPARVALGLCRAACHGVWPCRAVPWAHGSAWPPSWGRTHGHAGVQAQRHTPPVPSCAACVGLAVKSNSSLV